VALRWRHHGTVLLIAKFSPLFALKSPLVPVLDAGTAFVKPARALGDGVHIVVALIDESCNTACLRFARSDAATIADEDSSSSRSTSSVDKVIQQQLNGDSKSRVRCEASALRLINNCEIMTKHLGCPNGCEASWGAEQPAQVTQATLTNHKACLVNTRPGVATCAAHHEDTRRLCTCAEPL
jgi:hypothetical protein